MKVNVIKYRNLWFVISGILVVASIVSLATMGLKFGIDFTGGSLLEVDFAAERPLEADVRVAIEELGFTGVQVQASGEEGLLIRTANLSEEEHQSILTTISEKFGQAEELRFDSIGPVIGQELRRTALTGLALTLALIGLYIAWAFRKVSEPIASWKYGLLTILAAFHDVLITLGVFSVLGHFYGWEVGTSFVAATLTILGYSINDTVVVFDRTRENLGRHRGQKFEDTVSHSISETFTRSINTSFTTLLALIAIFIFGGESTKPFALALIVGIVIGTYSSILIASPALVAWEKWRSR